MSKFQVVRLVLISKHVYMV